MDQLIDPSNDTSVSHPSIDLSNYTSLSYPQIDLQPMNYKYYTYPLIDLSNNSSMNYLPVNLLDYNYPQINLSDNTSLSDDLPDCTSLGCLPIDLSNDTFISNPQIDLLNDLNHPQTNYSTSNNSSIDLSSDTSLNSPIDLPDNTSLSHSSIDLLNNTSLSYPLIDQTKEPTSLNYPTQNTLKPDIKKCTECNKEENFANEMHVIRHPYHEEATVTLSGNKVIDDFIISILKLNELKIFYNFILKHTGSNEIYNDTNRYFGITQNPNTQNFMIITKRPFWDRSHDTELIIEICDGLRPPNVTNAPEGYIELMQKCWHSDPNERPSASDVSKKFDYTGNLHERKERYNPTKIISSPDIGPVTTNNPGAIYKSRPLSTMIKSANFTRSLRLKSQNAALGLDKRKFNNNLIENNNNNKDKIHKRLKYCEEQNHDDYLTQELEFDINCNTNSNKSEDNDYITSELNFDI
ncbi:unnamed protein product [Rhizophagus irregularis]|nr:unnamed protein product [Rhizophagus irregularis]